MHGKENAAPMQQWRQANRCNGAAQPNAPKPPPQPLNVIQKTYPPRRWRGCNAQ